MFIKFQPWPFTSNPFPTATARPAILLRNAKRNGKRIERKTLANLSKTPAFIVDAIGILLKGGLIVHSLDQAFTVQPLAAARTCRGSRRFGFAARTAAHFA